MNPKAKDRRTRPEVKPAPEPTAEVTPGPAPTPEPQREPKTPDESDSQEVINEFVEAETTGTATVPVVSASTGIAGKSHFYSGSEIGNYQFPGR
jgi:hypothetical protein